MLARSLLAIAALALLTACSDEDSPEQQVRAVIEQMERAVEARDVGDVVALLSSEYRDAYGNTADDVSRRIRGYFIANQSIHLLTRIEELSFPHPDEARATVLVGMVGREADAAGAWNLATELRTFDVVFIREDDDWKVSWAQWR